MYFFGADARPHFAGWMFTLLALVGTFFSSSPLVTADNGDDTYVGQWWKAFLSSSDGNSWFEHWSTLMQAKFDELAVIAESEASRAVAASRGDDPSSTPYRILMVGDSTMKHQFGAACGFLAERHGKRFDPKISQAGSAGGCCVDTAGEERGGGRGLCFEYQSYRFLNPSYAGSHEVDAFYFGCGLHLLHITPLRPLEALRTQEWLAYEHLLENTVAAVRETNGPEVKIVFMTTHTVSSQVFRGMFADIRDAYRTEPGNATILAACEEQMENATYGDPMELHYPEHTILLDGYPKGEGGFTPDVYCREGLLDRHGSLQLNRRAKHAMMRAGVPIVDAGRIVEGQAWASHPEDGRHFHSLVPIELYTLLGVLTSPPPLPSDPGVILGVSFVDFGGDEGADLQSSVAVGKDGD